ncbi:MAG: cell division protein FtsX [Chlorobi bacterium]|nr:cell division protein FtsX [Chlorobiota bacterium]
MSKSYHTTARRKLRSSYFTTIISIALVLFVLGIIGLLLLNANRLSVYVKENLGFTILLKGNARTAEVKRLEKVLKTSDFIKSTEYIDKDRAAKELEQELGEDFVDFLGYNPLLSSIDVKLYADYTSPDSIAKIEKILLDFPQVKEVYYQKNLVHLVHKNVNRISLVLSLFAFLLLTIAIALINNTIRLSVYSKRFLIRTMQLVGATKGFIRKPFLLRSIMHGFLGALIAIILLTGLIYVTSKELSEVVGFQNLDLIFVLFGIVIVLGILITFTSTYFSVNKYLRLSTNELYY